MAGNQSTSSSGLDSLGRLNDDLPSATQQSKEQQQQAFRSAALSLTSLFKAGQKATQDAYLAGKREALQDVLEFIQAGLDHPLTQSTNASANGGQQGQVARLIDYICARQETLSALEDPDEDDPSDPVPTPRAPPKAPTTSTSRPRPRPSSPHLYRTQLPPSSSFTFQPPPPSSSPIHQTLTKILRKPKGKSSQTQTQSQSSGEDITLDEFGSGGGGGGTKRRWKASEDREGEEIMMEMEENERPLKRSMHLIQADTGAEGAARAQEERL